MTADRSITYMTYGQIVIYPTTLDLYEMELIFFGLDERVYYCSSSCDVQAPSADVWDRDHRAIQDTPTEGFKCLRAAYSSNKTSIVTKKARSTANYHVPTSRGYHTAVVVQLNGRDQLLIWGGLHGRAPTGQLELLDLTHSSERDSDQSPWTRGRLIHTVLYVLCVLC